MPFTRSHRSVEEPEAVAVAPTRGWGRVCDMGQGLARGATPPRGQTRSASLDPAYETERPTGYASLSPAPDTALLIRELLLRLLDRSEGAPSAQLLASTVSVGPSIALTNSAMHYVAPSSVPIDPPMTSTILP